MIATLLPVKSFARSKQRLAEFLSPAERTLLAQTMFEDVFAALREAAGQREGVERLLVASAEPYVAARCREEQVDFLAEQDQISHSESVCRATAWAMELGATSLLAVPIDTPAVTAIEILALLQEGRRSQVVIVPSADGSGTNALLRTPADAIPPRFGPDSCRLHAREAEARGLTYRVLPLPGLSHDLDAPEDLDGFLSEPRPCRSWSLAQRLVQARQGVASCR